MFRRDGEFHGRLVRIIAEFSFSLFHSLMFSQVKGTAQFFTVNQTTHLSSPLPLLLLCGSRLSVRPIRESDGEVDDGANQHTSKPTASRGDRQRKKTAILTLDGWIVFQCDADAAAHLVVLRKRLDSAFWHAIANPTASKKRSNSVEKGRSLLSNLTGAERDAIEIVGTVLQSAHVQSESTRKSTGPAGN